MTASRRRWLLERLMQADGPRYDELVGEMIDAIPHSVRRVAGIRAVKAIRQLLRDGLAVTENDESMWLTPLGWERLGGSGETRPACG